MNQYNIFKDFLRGVGQVVFLDNALSGALMLLGIAFNSPFMCIGTLMGTIVSTLTATGLNYDDTEIDKGLYGFNGTLVGIAVPCFLSINVWSVLLLIIASALSTWVVHISGKQKLLPVLTAPFVLITWLLLLMTAAVPNLRMTDDIAYVAETTFHPLKAFSLGFGQIMLQGNTMITGFLFLTAIAVNSIRMGGRAALACLLSSSLAVCPFIETSVMNNGLMGYNAVLAFVAITDVVPMASWRYLKAFAAILLSCLFQFVGLHLGLTTLTAPFVLAVWIVVLCDKIETRLSSNQFRTGSIR